jgi:hypothetical protein
MPTDAGAIRGKAAVLVAAMIGNPSIILEYLAACVKISLLIAGHTEGILRTIL